jgi:hypothetical protein
MRRGFAVKHKKGLERFRKVQGSLERFREVWRFRGLGRLRGTLLNQPVLNLY